MYDNRIFNPDRLGSEDEEESLQYNGFVILVQVRTENPMQWAKSHFCRDGFEFSEENNRYIITCNFCDSTIEVFPEKTKYKDKYDLRSETYDLVLQSVYFGSKWYDEINHQALGREVLSKIPKKRGFWLKEGKRFPITRRIRIAIPKRRYRFTR